MNKQSAKRIRQNRHSQFYRSVRFEREFKQAAKALPINIKILTKGKRK